MLTFLRKIRKSLIDAGNTKRYVLYAIGEIALVVLGILIALQINNWNENQKSKKSEEKFYTDILFDLDKDSVKIEYLIEFYDNRIVQLGWLLNEIRNAKTNTDIIEFGKRVEPLYYSEEAVSYSATYDAAKSSGDFSNFKNKMILKRLTQYYSDFKEVSDLITTILRIIETQMEPLLATIPENYIVKESGDYVFARNGNSDFYEYIESIEDNRNISVDLESFLQKPELENYIIGDLGRSFNGLSTFNNRRDEILSLRREIKSIINN